MIWTFCLSTLAYGQISPPSIPPPSENRLPANTRAIEGVIQDKQNNPVKGATVLLKDTKTLQIRSYISGEDGTYHFFGLSDDVNYAVRAQSGDLTSKQKLVSVFESHQRIKLNLKLTKQKKD